MEDLEIKILLEEIRAERKRIDEKRAEIHAMTMQIQKEAAALHERCPHGNMVCESYGWEDPVGYCPDCGYCW